eukprot:763230-Hanusia_phi.AAC.4
MRSCCERESGGGASVHCESVKLRPGKKAGGGGGGSRPEAWGARREDATAFASSPASDVTR